MYFHFVSHIFIINHKCIQKHMKISDNYDYTTHFDDGDDTLLLLFD